MSAITRSALRVYATLAELRRDDEDVLDALIPFFEPILEVMNGRVFDPRVFAVGVQKLYHWRFTADIAEHFIPRLLKKGHLERKGLARDGVYIVKFSPIATSDALPISDVLNRIIDEFEHFPPRITDLLTYTRTREELTEILIRFLISMDAYGEAAFAEEIKRLQLGIDDQRLLDSLEEGGTSLRLEDRYMCARFVQALCKEYPEYVPHLARLASIGLLTEVVTDFVKPTQPESRTNLTVVVDAPLALDFLGCSGHALQNDVKSIFDALKGIGCSLVVFPITFGEMQRNLQSMLALPPHKRHGYTHQAMVRGEVLPQYVEAVARNPETALETAGIAVKPLDLDQFPGSHVCFDKERHEDFFEAVFWVPQVEPREHDATCLTLVMRLRAGKHHSDLFRSGYCLVTRNPTFVKESRSYCLKNRLITAVQEPPVIHQRELATVAWLRTGLGVHEQIPKMHLLATCDRVLRPRLEVQDAIAASLKQFTPEKVPQFELLLQDQRSLRRMADETLNDYRVVTAENAGELLEAMRLATIAEEREQFQNKLQDEKKKHDRSQRQTRDAAKAIAAERDAAQALLQAREVSDGMWLKKTTTDISRLAKRIEGIATAGLLFLGALAIVESQTKWLGGTKFWIIVSGAAGLYGLYSLLMTLLERHKIGLATCLNLISRTILKRRLAMANLSQKYPLSDFEINDGRVNYKIEILLPSPVVPKLSGT